jgi:hypothetical protein
MLDQALGALLSSEELPPRPILWSNLKLTHIVPDPRVLDTKGWKMRLRYVQGAVVEGSRTGPVLIQSPPLSATLVSKTKTTKDNMRTYPEVSMALKLGPTFDDKGVDVASQFTSTCLRGLEEDLRPNIQSWFDSGVDSHLPITTKSLVEPPVSPHPASMWARMQLDKRGKPENCPILDEKNVKRSLVDLEKALKEQKATVQVMLHFADVYWLPDKRQWGVNVFVRGVRYSPAVQQFNDVEFID